MQYIMAQTNDIIPNMNMVPPPLELSWPEKDKLGGYFYSN